jgi:penicillin V acylase-like amidase (Ntn superfamily)/uncharacterized protein (DUF2141 family)
MNSILIPHMKKTISVLALLITIISTASACSAVFVKKGQMYLGKNFDWYSGNGIILQNRRGMKKVAYGLDTNNVVGWTSRYGSITFNQVGKEFPYGGVNERGLAIEMLWYSDSYYEESGKPTLSELEWVQYNLDNYKTAAEVQFYLDSMNINPVHSNLHYIVADRGGRSFVVDFVNGKAVVSNTKDEFQALTNSNYKSSLTYFEKNKDKINFESRESEDRFCQLTDNVQRRDTRRIESMFTLLKESSEERDNYKTYWTIVYDLGNMMLYFKSFDNQKVKQINLADIGLSKSSVSYAMDINIDQVHWKKYTADWNLTLLSSSMKQAGILLNLDQANQHMMQPDQFVMDDIYRNEHEDLKVIFSIKNQKGLIFYSLMKGEENYKRFRGTVSALTRANAKTIKRVHYSLRKGEYALAAFHDKNSNSRLDKFIGIPTEPTAFSNGKKASFGPPTFEQVKFKLQDKLVLPIKIR